MSSQPKGLPGFLRRSLRFTDEEKETAEIAELGDGDGGRGTPVNDASSAIPRSSILTPTGTPMATPAPTPVVAKPTRKDLTSGMMPDVTALDATPSGKVGSWKEEPHKPTAATTAKQSLARNTSYKDRQLDAALFADIVNMAELKSLCWNGIPPSHRPLAWKILLGYLPTNKARRSQTLARKRAEYKDAILQHYDIDDDVRTGQEQETLRQVLVDVPRTSPEVGLFRNDRIRKALSRLLFVWAMRHPASSYVQGINDLATPFIVVYLGEYFPNHTCDNVLDGEIVDQVNDEIMEEVS